MPFKEHGDNNITVNIFDKDKIGKDEPLGTASIDVRRISHAANISQVWEVLTGCKGGKILYSAQFTAASPELPAEAPSSVTEADYIDPQDNITDPLALTTDTAGSDVEVVEDRDEVELFDKPETVQEHSEHQGIRLAFRVLILSDIRPIILLDIRTIILPDIR